MRNSLFLYKAIKIKLKIKWKNILCMKINSERKLENPKCFKRTRGA